MDPQTLHERNVKELVAIFFSTATSTLTETGTHCKPLLLALPLLPVRGLAQYEKKESTTASSTKSVFAWFTYKNTASVFV